MKNTEMNTTSNTEMVTISRAEYEKMQQDLEKLKAQNGLLLEALSIARHKQFGASSEKLSEEGMEQLSLLFNEAEAYQPEEAVAEADNEVEVTAHKRHKKHEYTLDNLPENIPTEVVEHRLAEAELVCPECGDTMTEIGKDVVKTLVIVPAKVIVKEHHYYAYACRRCEQENIETPVVKATRETNIIPGSFASPEAIAHIMTQKFVMGSPLYRQEQELSRQGIPLSRQTMSNWILKAAEDYLQPVYDRLHEELLQRDVLHADETTLQVLKEPGKAAQSKSYMWLYRTSGDTQKPIVLYDYQPGRGQEHPKNFLKGFTGYLHTDGYEAYHTLSEDVTVVGCWAHARRKFDEAVKALPKGKAKTGAAAQGLACCSLLFATEDNLKDLSPEERYEARLEQEKPVLDALLAWANTRQAASKSALGKALEYLRNQWPYLTNYLLDGRLELSNNRAERSIKPFVIDRKNFLFANTPKGAQGSAVIFSLIRTAIENGLDPYRYLVWLMSTAKDAEIGSSEHLLPWNAPEECRVK